jgi:hypothetical protein
MMQTWVFQSRQHSIKGVAEMSFVSALARGLHRANKKQGQLLSFSKFVPSTFLYSLTRELGSIVPEENQRPSAILITKRDVPEDLERFAVSNELEAAAFRVEAPETCQRYFLAEGFDLATMYTVAPLLLPAEFPAVTSSEFKVENLAEAIADDLLGGVSGFTVFDRATLVSDLTYSLRITSEIFRGASSTLDSPWNVEWLAFVQTAIDSLLELVPSVTSEQQLHALVFSSLGLPSSDYPSVWKYDPSKVASELLKSFEAFWSNKSEVDKSTDFLKTRFAADMGERLLCAFDGAQFEVQVNIGGPSLISLLRAVSLLGLSMAGRDQFFPASDFISPRSNDEKRGTLSISDSEDNQLGLTRSDEVPPFLVGVHEGGASPELLIRIPLFEEYLEGANLADEIFITTNLPGSSFVLESAGQSDGDLVLVGHFLLQDELLADLNDVTVLKAVLAYDLSPDSKLVGLLPSSSRCNFLFARLWGPSYAILSDPSSKSLAKAEVWVFSDTPQEVEIEGGQRSLSIAVFGPQPEFEGRPMTRFGPPNFYKEVTTVSNRMDLSSDGSLMHLFTQEKAYQHESPILAAAHKENLSASRPSYSNQLSIRGKLEDLFSNGISNSAFTDENFHVALAETIPLDSNSLNSEYLRGLVTNLPVAGMLQEIPFEVSQEFLDSAEVSEFKQAFKALNLVEQLQNSVDGSLDWPSKTSWRSLFEKPSALNLMLGRFSEMLKASERYGNASRFWAAYPYSTSIWDMDNQSCSAVLLSPLHPLRLAWLASVEHGLWETPDAQNFMGVIEGWNFPYLGPGVFSDSSMVAIPTDLGDESLFAGWSMLVPIPGGQPSPLVGPPLAANLPAPGASATGFNASTAKSALRAFRKINNHLNDFVVDLGLSQNKSSPRLAEVDAAVIDEAESLLNSGELYGGVHIFDSSKRTGLPPYQRLSEVALKSYPKPFSWSVYEDAPNSQVRSHLKMLQDPGIKIQISKTGAKSSSNLSGVPYKRFVGSPLNQPMAVGETLFVPRIDPDVSTWTEFAQAVSAVENLAYGDQISASLQLSTIAGGDAEWTVSGEGMIGPAAIMSLLSSSPVRNSMLWEWRPPFLNAKSLAQELSRRPYFVIAKVPSSFKSQIANKVLKALPAEPQSERIATDALTLLGGRGMGLSGLMSMGTTHTTGALGFYAAFDLLDKVTLPDGKGLIVLPIDACEPFIETLSGQKTVDLKKRADLLAIAFDEENAVLLPIEVKLIGLDAEASVSPTLPGPSSRALDEAISQARNTAKSLQVLVERGDSFLSSGVGAEGDLWRTNFAALLDAGAKLTKLSNPQASKLSKLLGRVLNGVANLRVGAPVITYFHAATSDGAGRAWITEEVPAVDGSLVNRILVCSIGLALSSSVDKERMLIAWNDLFVSASSAQVLGPEVPGQESVEIDRSPDEADETGAHDNEAAVTNTSQSEADKGDISGEVDGPEDKSGASENEHAPEDKSDTVIGPKDDSGVIPPPAGGATGYRTIIGCGQTEQEIEWKPGSIEQGVMMGVVGRPGMGKTQLVMSVLQDLMTQRNPDGSSTAVIIFDFKGEFSVNEDLVSKFGLDVVRVTEPVPFDIWAVPDAAKNERGVNHRILQICDTLHSIYNIGPNQKFRLSAVLTNEYKKRGFSAPSLADIAEGYAKARGKSPADTIDSILNTFKLTGAFEPDTRSANLPSMQDYLSSGRVILDFQLDHIASPEIVKFYATVILNEYNQLMMSRQNQTSFRDGWRDIKSLLVIDEAHNLMEHKPQSLGSIQRMGRSKGFALVLATQELSHFSPNPGTNYSKLIDTWALFSSSGLTRASLNEAGASPDTSQRLFNAINQLAQGQAAFLTPSDKAGDWGEAAQFWKRRSE